VAVGDVNGDGIPDIITGPGPGGGSLVKVFNGRDGSLLQSFNAYGSGVTDGIYVASADVNGDGLADIITGTESGSQPLVQVFSGLDDTLLASFLADDASMTGGVRVAAGDVNGDGKADIIWYDSAAGQVVIWLMDGVSVIGGGSPGSAPVAWFAIGTGDFNGDGKTDILWVNQFTGQVLIWLLDGTTTPPSVIGGGSLGSAASPWHVRETGDFNGDGMSDILWQNTSTGEVVMWFIDGKTMPPSVIGGGSPGTVTSDWQLQGLNAD